MSGSLTVRCIIEATRLMLFRDTKLLSLLRSMQGTEMYSAGIMYNF